MMAIYPQMHQPMEHQPQWWPQQQPPQGGKRKRSRRRPRTRRRSHRNARLRADSESGVSVSSASTADTASVTSSSDGSHESPRNGYRKNPQMYPRQVHVNSKWDAPMTEAEQGQYVAMDCEMVGIGQDGRQSALARVTLIDWHGVVLMDEYVQQEQEVTDYRTFVSGITPKLVHQARMDLATCRQLVLHHLDGKMLVGHGLKNDLRVLGITHPWFMTRDTARYEPFMKVRFNDGVLWPRSLKELCQEKLQRQVQVYGKPHCPYEDALAALDLYRLVCHKWEKTMEYKMNKTRAIEQRLQQQH